MTWNEPLAYYMVLDRCLCISCYRPSNVALLNSWFTEILCHYNISVCLALFLRYTRDTLYSLNLLSVPFLFYFDLIYILLDIAFYFEMESVLFIFNVCILLFLLININHILYYRLNDSTALQSALPLKRLNRISRTSHARSNPFCSNIR